MYRYFSNIKTNSLENPLPWTHSYCELLKHQCWLSPLCTCITEGAFPTTWIQGQCTKRSNIEAALVNTCCRGQDFVHPQGLLAAIGFCQDGPKRFKEQEASFIPSTWTWGMKQNTTTNYKIRCWYSLDMEQNFKGMSLITKKASSNR